MHSSIICKIGTSSMNQPITAHLCYLLTTACFLLICKGANIKIINGDDVIPHSRPYIALIETLNEKKKTICAGSLIKPDWVLTAAHCKLIAKITTVTLGAHSMTQNESEKQKMKVIRLFPYGLYNRTAKQNDIQLLQLSKKATLGDAVNIIPLPETFEDIPEGTVCRIDGWGRTESGNHSDTLKEAHVAILNRTKCIKDWRHKYVITADMICTNVGSDRQDTCKGDSGSPLICNDVFRGVNSFGYVPCGTPETSNVFTQLTQKYILWINNIINNK
ncbi:granzyme A-like [Aquarana catesbeiana]|uniref:granzyme A-like n=1 Tax=Aquarana catesbeiana TaxID=8400 RepID=UPI003CCA45F6